MSVLYKVTHIVCTFDTDLNVEYRTYVNKVGDLKYLLKFDSFSDVFQAAEHIDKKQRESSIPSKSPFCHILRHVDSFLQSLISINRPQIIAAEKSAILFFDLKIRPKP